MNPATISSHEVFDRDAPYGVELQDHGSLASMPYLAPAGGPAPWDWRWRIATSAELLQDKRRDASSSIATDERLLMHHPAEDPDCTAFGSTILGDPWQSDLERMATAWQSYGERVRTLHATAEDEGECVNPASEQDFWTLMWSGPLMKKANVVLLDNGNLRAVWKGASGEHLGVQFIGGQMAQYVIFTRRPETRKISRLAGRDGLRAFGEIINAFNLHSLLDA